MKKRVMTVGVLLLALFCSAEELQVLIFGNSYSGGALLQLPKIAASFGDRVEVLCLRGIPSNHAAAIRKESSGEELIAAHEAKRLKPRLAAEAGYVALESDYDARVRVIETLQSKPWDFVVFQSHSSQANNRSVWEADLLSVVEAVDEYAPDAEFMLYFTTQYRNDGLLYGAEVNKTVYQKINRSYPYTEDEHFLDAYEVYYGLAEKIGCRVVPGGTAFQNARYAPDWPHEQFPAPGFDYADPDAGVPPQEKSLRKGLFRGGRNAHKELGWWLNSHPSPVGNYLTGLVYYQMLFGKTPEGCEYKPVEPVLSDAEAAVLQRIARETVEGRMPPLRLENPKSIARYNAIVKGLENPGISEAADDPGYFEQTRQIWERYGSKAR